VDDKKKFLKEIKRVLVDKGRLAIIEFAKVKMDKGPKFEHRLSSQEIIDLSSEEFGCIESSMLNEMFSITLLKA
jgi:ubiquinone/menaquinone biosynthesis C-methylase UbiE